MNRVTDDFDREIAGLLLAWGKAEKNSHNWEPAILHMLTVGIVAKELYDSLPRRLRKRIAKGLGLKEKQLSNMLPIVASLHDIGKIAVGHQLLRPDLPPLTRLRALGFSLDKNRDLNHKQVAFSYIKQAIEHIGICSRDFASSALMAYTLAAHHGELYSVDSDMISDDDQWDELRDVAARQIATAFRCHSDTAIQVGSLSALLLLAGLTTLADWIGSSVEFFPYCSIQDYADVDVFLGECKRRAFEAVSSLGLNAQLMAEAAFGEVFDGKQPNAAQQAAFRAAAKLTHPMILIVLSSTGSGKTEIPLGLFADSAVKEDLRGLYFALPTQGTANQNFQRLKEFTDRLLFTGNPQLHLLHSISEIDETYSKLKMSIDDGSNIEDGTVTASDWFSTSKKGLAATFGGGTIDQALLSVLRVKWMPLRLFALAGKLVVLDEIHSYDTYMTRSINRFLEWAPYIESSVVALTATLPQKAIKELLKSFSPGAEPPEVITYPCVIGVDGSGRIALEVIPVEDFKTSATLSPLVVDSLTPPETLVRKIEGILVEDGNIAVIMNSIGEAQKLAEAIQRSETLRNTELIVYHSRFTVADRTGIEQKIRSKYGKEGFCNGQRPRKSIVVATQVLEQSLDVDFDFMISWLAPIDLLLQRLGRLRRFFKMYPRKGGRILYVAMNDSFSANRQFGISGLVYFPDVLHKTAELFRNGGSYQDVTIDLPEDASPLIETVYDERNEDVISAWEKDRLGKQLGEVYIAESNLLPHAHGHEGFENNPEFIDMCLREASDETKVSSRLAEASVTVVLLSPGDKTSVEPRDHESLLSLWSKSLPVRNQGLVHEFLSINPPAEWQNTPLLRSSRPLYLDKETRLGGYKLAYNALWGLVIEKIKKGEE